MIGGKEVLSQSGYEYDLASRLNAVKSGETRVEYSYLENSGLVEEIILKHGATASMKTKKEYDWFGNLINNGLWKYTRDAGNRLIGMESVAGVPPEAQKRLEFQYDWHNRHVGNKVYEGKNDKPTLSRIFVYDGWNLVAEFYDLRSPTSDLQSYLWCLDLSGNQQSVGGVGDLLKVSSKTDSEIFFAYDGNVAGLFNATTGTPITRYEYSLFGEVVSVSGTRSENNPFQRHQLH